MSDEHARPWWRDYVEHPRHGPLPGLLVLLTVATGLVDGVSILALGRVFVANMTGNVAFLGFALGGAPGFSLDASVVALGAFLVGAGLGGALVRRRRAHRGRLLRDATVPVIGLLVAAVVVLAVARPPYDGAVQVLVVALSALALGLQNAAVRGLAVPDLTTTVLTMTLTGVAADLRGGDHRTTTRRVLAVVAMLVGALVGTLLVRGPGAAVALGVAVLLEAVVLGAVAAASRRTASWQSGP
ncbi:YoaK family protein [Lapillicoccus jejuensis]|uniref:Uncharacterized membrane protein YoaK (UPF0700 family) n=1 Tax=Lapillicoccus jejuensis TaxID=402171 RepID=A0A542E493_9MICO|nr:YoaK family protein [Lapillicoccus jejuensis]TQJ10084.1 uncharacterized membrane protein YoaK (UPF0700 family) [Lapillicoccus jejuensis]